MPFIEQLGQEMAGNSANGVLGIALGAYNDKRQVQQQRRLQDLQLEGDKTRMERQLQMWKDTSYGAQKEQMVKAGINPALLYGMGGGGGQTTGNAGSSAGGTATQGGGNEVLGMVGMGIQSKMAQAQVEVMQSQADLNKAQAEKTRGVDTAEGEARINSLTAGVENTKAQAILTGIQTEIAQVQAVVSRQTINDQMHTIENLANKSSAELSKLQLDNQLSASQMNDKIKLLRQELVNAALQATAIKENINLTKEQINKISNDILVNWGQLDVNAQNANTQQKLQEFTTGHPDLQKLLGGAIQRIADAVQDPLPAKK